MWSRVITTVRRPDSGLCVPYPARSNKSNVTNYVECLGSD